jgi:hypothetical protein
MGTETGSTILNLNPSGSDGIAPHSTAVEEEVQECAISRKHHGYRLFRSEKYHPYYVSYLLMFLAILSNTSHIISIM